MNDVTKELFDRLLNAVPVEIDYKHKLFLEETEKYTDYKKAGGKESVYKKSVSSLDVKLDIIRNKGDKRLKELEAKYIRSVTVRAANADERLSDFFKDDLAEKFHNFGIEIYNARKKGDKYKTKQDYHEEKDVCDKKGDEFFYLDRQGTRGLSLVYKKSPKDKKVADLVYQFDSLGILLDAIAKSTVCYCIGGKDYSALDEIEKADKPSREVVTPLLIRKICALTCYALLEFGNYISVVINNIQLTKGTGVTSQIMHDLHLRCIELGYPYFSKEIKLFQNDKWSISPETMLRDGTFIAPKMPITYAGMKQGWLGYLLARLQEQVVYENFIDVFGGSGASSVQFLHNLEADYYINDLHYANVAYYRVLLAPQGEYKKFLECLMLIKDAVFILGEKFSGDTKSLNNYAKELYNIYDDVSDICLNNALDIFMLCDRLQEKFNKIMRSIFNLDNREYKDVRCDFYIIVAAVFVAFANMPVSGDIKPHIKGSIKQFTKKSKDYFQGMFDDLRRAFKDIKVISPYGMDAMSMLRSNKFNNDETLAYIDSPYIGTLEYSASKASGTPKYKEGTIIEAKNCGNEFISTDFPMDTLLDVCDDYKGNFIFSCRLNMPNPNPEAVVTGTFHRDIGDEDDYFDEKRVKIADENKVHCNYNNYIWFFRRWLKMKNIDNCFVYCMVDTDWSILKENSKFRYYDNIIQDVYSKKKVYDFDKGRDAFVNSWGKEYDATFKNNLFDYLKYIVLVGEDFEIMITNKDLDAPNFDSMYENEGDYNYYKKQAFTLRSKYTKKGKFLNSNKTEIRIPKHGEFIKIPMKVISNFVLTVFADYKRGFKIK